MLRLVTLTAAALLIGTPAGADPEIAPASAGNFRTIRTTSGPVRGRISDGIVSFRGIPYASPPVGALRWRAPQPVKSWTGVRDALEFSAPCAQAALGWNDAIAADSREDCLYLNVWAPVRSSGGPLPVIVFFPGGAYHGGSARGLSAIEPSYDGSRLAARGVIVVSANYRVGMFGFLAHPQLSAESPRHSSGNYALLDSLAALRWTRDNIARFGGNPRNVTATGQSAGSATVGYLMTSRLSQGLFQKAIALSGPIVNDSPELQDLAQAERAGVEFTRALKISAAPSIAELRKRPAHELLAAMLADPQVLRSEPKRVIVDGYVLSEQPAAVYRDGREMPLPLIIGATARDGDFDSMGVSGTPKAQATVADASRPLSDSHRVTGLASGDAAAIQQYYAGFTDLPARAVALYGGTDSTEPADGDAAVAFYTDIVFRCGSSLTARWHSRVAPVWLYQFSHGYEPLGAVHLWDLMYVFGWLQPPADQPRDARLSTQVQEYWAAFARSGDPNSAELPVWPRWGPAGDYLDFRAAGASARAGLRSAACELFELKTQRELGTAPPAATTPQK